ncbi:uncharacterized mitochondrial protein AtMg00860-like [Rutidosis leptorrhynchoides]|uniref:uncharacterized mitochondrial protein AtMg00860-like n=1 Tax=Rutidosis leptorrhynchoides TaxID=125765 RepID=UPI003A9961EC
MCINYRESNKTTIKNRYLLPRTDDQFNRLQGSSVYLMIDLRSEYHQWRVSEEDVLKTTFRTRYGYYEFFNDAIREENDEHLRLLLELRGKEKVYAKFSKCEFWLSKVQFLNHIVSNQGIQVDPTNIEVIENWKVTKTSTQVRKFLGLIGYYRRFIEDFSRIARALTALTHRGKKYTWSNEQETATMSKRLLLKKKLTFAPVLSLLEGNDDFIVILHAKDLGVY